MGWYDAYKGNTSRIDTRLDKGGNIGVALGNAFSDFGKALNQESESELKNKLTNLQIQNAETTAQNLAETKAQTKIDNAYLAEAYSRPNIQSFNANKDASWTPSADAVAKANKHFESEEEKLKKADEWVQKEFNADLTKAYAGGEYKSFKELKDANPELVEFADGVTVANIKKAFDDTSKQVATLKSAEEDMKHQASLLAKDKEILKLKKDAGASGGYDGETTNGKIVAIVAKGMGLDKDNLENITNEQRGEFEQTVAEISVLAKELNLSSNLALNAWHKIKEKQNQEKLTIEDNPLGIPLKK